MGAASLTNSLATHVSQTSPTTNYKSSYGLYLRTLGSQDSLAYLYFPRPFPLQATILSAKIKFYNAYAFSSATHTVTFQRLNQAFSVSTVTYNTRPTSLIAGTKTVTKTGTVAVDAEWEIDVTDWMQTVSNGGVHYGMRMIINEAVIRTFYSENHPTTALRPRLEISWSDAPQTPADLSPSGGRAVGLAKPVLKATYRDYSGATQLQALQVQINATDSWGAPSFDSGTVITSVPELDLNTTAYAGLSDGATTFWRIRFQDAAGVWSAWSTAVSFKRDDKGALQINNPPSGSPVQGTVGGAAFNVAALGSLLPAVGGTPPAWAAMTDQTFGTATSSTCTYPGTVGANNILLWQQFVQPSVGVTITPPDGTWTQLITIVAADLSHRVEWWYKRAAGGETGSVVFTHTSANRRASLHRFTGAVTTGNPFGEIVSGASVAASPATAPVGLAGAVDQLLVWGAAADSVSGWTSPPGYTERLDAGATTLATKPGAGGSPAVEDATPPIAWMFTGETQAAYQVQVRHVVNGVQVIDWDSGKVTSTVTSVTVPSGIDEPTNTTYTITVRIWDTKQREATPGDPTYVEVVRNFTFIPGATTGTTVLTAVPQDPVPKVLLTWTAATFPDRFNILRNGKVIAAALDPTTTFVSGTTHTYIDQSPSPGRALTYSVQRVVNNVASATNPTAVATVRSSGIWLREPLSGLDLCLFGIDGREFTLGEQGAILQSIAQNANKVAINQSLGGLEGRVEGTLENMYGLTAQQWRDIYLQLRALRVKKFWLTVGDYTFEVVAQNFSYSPLPTGETRFRVGFDVYQQNSVSTALLGS